MPLNFASVRIAHYLFVCENNFYSTHMPIRECRTETNIYKVAAPFRIDSCQVDGNDVLAVYEAGRKAVDQCRSGDGPVFIECLTYRLRGHVGPDDNIQGSHTDIRQKDEVEFWRGKDPIRRFEDYLLVNGIAEQKELDNIRREAASRSG